MLCSYTTELKSSSHRIVYILYAFRKKNRRDRVKYSRCCAALKIIKKTNDQNLKQYFTLFSAVCFQSEYFNVSK